MMLLRKVGNILRGLLEDTISHLQLSRAFTLRGDLHTEEAFVAALQRGGMGKRGRTEPFGHI
jgi:hypothetical protein